MPFDTGPIAAENQFPCQTPVVCLARMYTKIFSHPIFHSLCKTLPISHLTVIHRAMAVAGIQKTPTLPLASPYLHLGPWQLAKGMVKIKQPSDSLCCCQVSSQSCRHWHGQRLPLAMALLAQKFRGKGERKLRVDLLCGKWCPHHRWRAR